MGILNITPDSFYDGGGIISKESIESKLDQLLKCDIIDVGAESTRPGSKRISITEELARLSLFFDLNLNLKKHFFSIDTYKPEVASFCLSRGFKCVNDITGGSPEMFKICAKFNSKIVIMHMFGDPESMHNDFFYHDIMKELDLFYKDKIRMARSYGLEDSQLIIDPGLGFGKKNEDNVVIIQKLSELKKFGLPILIGLSRKRFLGNEPPEKKMIKSVVANTLALANGADMIRVHDILEHIDMKEIIKTICNGSA